eukprot:Cvel_25047.t2-p1 / transcript=Cvel_25047.t2 / gene=Cvel_25047 / organism=Chromera_velia_CCMP2878 / gene_product=hypothetical protein / transcript_product=hypothetical protein / location=Cvel_scaffold2785:9143-10569(+) / protein_length=308 / sequence_SO=supercontig / SO=protein_coding / is_pseudo=false
MGPLIFWPLFFSHFLLLTEASRKSVLGSLTTIPDRVPFLNETLFSLVTQTVQLDAIVLTITKDGAQKQGPPVILPEWVLLSPQIVVLETDKDWGPAKKLVPLLHEGSVVLKNGTSLVLGERDRVVTFDDDRIYAPWTVEVMLMYSLEFPDVVIGNDGHQIDTMMYTKNNVCPKVLHGTRENRKVEVKMKKKRKLRNWLTENGYISEDTEPPGLLSDLYLRVADVLVGCGAVMYQPRFFDSELFDFDTYDSHCSKVDDVWFASHLERRHIPRLRITLKDPANGGDAYDFGNKRGSADMVSPMLKPVPAE